jgi:hypothetical protein
MVMVKIYNRLSRDDIRIEVFGQTIKSFLPPYEWNHHCEITLKPGQLHAETKSHRLLKLRWKDQRGVNDYFEMYSTHDFNGCIIEVRDPDYASAKFPKVHSTKDGSPTNASITGGSPTNANGPAYSDHEPSGTKGGPEIPPEIAESVKKLHKQNKEHQFMDKIEGWKEQIALNNEAVKEHAATLGDMQMSTASYKAWLIKMGIVQSHDDVDVCHIIANSNGGADHPDNYIFLLSSRFNRSIGDKVDELNCYLSGEEKTVRAIKASRTHGNKPRANKAKIYYDQMPPRRFSNDDREEAKRLIVAGETIIKMGRQMKDMVWKPGGGVFA